jgi:hypothetical protein
VALPHLFELEVTIMAATTGQQGITKNLSGANAAFNDKVRLYSSDLSM